MQRLLVSTALIAILAAAAAAAQTQPSAADAPPAPRPVTTNSAQSIAARSVARMALADLKLMKPAVDRDYRIASEIMELAHELDPADQDILRLLIQGWTSAGDADRVDELNRELLRLDPRDTVTQLAIVSSRINRLQNVDERLASYERFLGPEGATVDAGIRSRLAMDAALLKRERGDDEGFAKTLATACQLDPTNKDAATLALAYFAGRVPDAIGRFELLTNVLKADPFDPEVHAAMAEELASGGAIRASRRFYTTLRQLRVARGEQLSPQETAESLVADWNVDGAEVLIRRLTDDVEASRADLRAKRERIAAANQALTEVADPAEVRLSIPFERTRVIAAAAIGDAELIGYAIDEAEESIRRALEVLASPDKRPKEMSDEDVTNTVRSLKIERVWLRLWAGRTTEAAAAEFEEIKNDSAADAPTLARMAACLKLRQGQLDEAETELTALAREDILAAVAMGILAELRGQKEPAVRLYTELSSRLAGSIAGAFCRTRIIQITGRPPAPSDLARKLQAVADAIPNSVESMISDPRRFVDLRVQTIGDEAGLLDKLQLRIAIENTSRFPLALGPDQPINSRFLLAPVVDLGVRRLGIAGLQETVWLNRRLRLMPGEKLEATVWADPGILGGLLQRVGSVSARIRWRVVQGFKLNRDGFYEPGALCLSTETSTLTRPAAARSIAPVASLFNWIERGTTLEMAESLYAFIERVTNPSPDKPELTKEEIDAFVAAVINRYRVATREEKAILLMTCPSAQQAPPFAALDAEIVKENDEPLLKAFLAVRVPRAESPILSETAWTSRPKLQAFADLVRARLADGERTIATLGNAAQPPDSAPGSGDPSAPIPAPPVPTPGK